MKLIRKIFNTVKLVSDSLEELERELKNLTGTTRYVIEELIAIWK